MVIWIIGLSGAGKTSLARSVYLLAKSKGIKNLVHLDGDRMREIYSNDLGHDLNSRRINSYRIEKICKLLDEQNIHVLCSILSIFPEAREWCRENFSSFYEVFIDAPISALIARDSKGIYSSKLDNNLAGIDITFPTPVNPDLIICNKSDLDALLSYQSQICELIIASQW